MGGLSEGDFLQAGADSSALEPGWTLHLHGLQWSHDASLRFNTAQGAT